MGLHLAILRSAKNAHRKPHGNTRTERRIRPIVRNARAELTYKRGLLAVSRLVQQALEGELDELKASFPADSTADSIRARDAVAAPNIDAILARARGKLGNLDRFAKRLVGLAVESNRESVDRRLAGEIQRAIGVNVSQQLLASGPLLRAMETATEENIALIRSIPEQYLDRVKNTVTEGWSQGMRWETVAKQLKEDGNVTDRRAKLIARDQTSKMNAAFNQERQQQVGIEEYVWSTSKDERVRPSHVAMDGKRCRWDKPPVVDDEAANPGEPINCRCVALPLINPAILSPSEAA